MDLDQLAAQIPPKYQFAGWLLVVVKYGAEFYSSVRSGGGLKRILCSFWFGEAVPSVIAKDYKEELNTKQPLPAQHNGSGSSL